MLLQVILEGIGLGVLLILVCAIGIRKGAVGMVHLYSQEVQERCVTLGLTTHAKIKRNEMCIRDSACPVTRHCHSEFPRGCYNLHASPS